MFEISIKSHFCGAHRLIGYKGKCANLHGHNWEVEVFLRGTRTNRLGMLVDFKNVKEILNGVLAKLDHQNLNALPIFKETNPTAENIAKFIFDELFPKFNSNPPATLGARPQHFAQRCGQVALRAGCRLNRVRVSETAGTSACYGRKL